MRLRNLIPAVLAAAALLVPAQAGASARPASHHPAARGHAVPRRAGHRHANRIGGHAGPGGRCHVTLSVASHVVTAGDSTEVEGRVRCPLPAPAGQPVTIFQREAPVPGFKIAGTTTTTAGGFYKMSTPALLHDSFFYADADGARSANRRVRVAPVVTVAGPAETTQLHTGRRHAVTFTGTVTPLDAGAELLLQREAATSSEEWVPIQREVIPPPAPGATFSTFTIVHTFVVPGDANLRVIVRTHGPFLQIGISNTLSYDISQAQNPRLTLLPSADPISFGQSATLSGVVAGAAANTPVTLLAHIRGGKFAPIEEGKTTAGGAYTFAQTPSHNTFYRVTSAGVSSAVLFEGVKYVLSLESAPPPTIPSGQVFTITGKAAPAQAGHAIYLERQNAFDGGFHVVDVGTIAGNGSWSIASALFGAGKTEVLRIHVPGDHENQGVSSSPFVVAVTPAPPGPLSPPPPVTLPGEGGI